MASVADRTRRIVKTKSGNGYIIRFKGMVIFSPSTSFKVTSKGPNATVTYVSGGTKKPIVEVKVGSKTEKTSYAKGKERWVVYFTKAYKKTPQRIKEGLATESGRLDQLKK